MGCKYNKNRIIIRAYNGIKIHRGILGIPCNFVMGFQKAMEKQKLTFKKRRIQSDVSNSVFTWNTYCENCTSSNGYISNAKTESQEHYNHHHHHKKLIDVVKEVKHSSSKDKSNNHGCNKPSSRHLATASSQLTFKDSSTNANSKLGRIQSRHRENTEVTMKLKIVLLLFIQRPITALWGVVWLDL